MTDWHPRQNAYPVVWELRNGQWAEPYAIVRAHRVRDNGRWVIRYELTSPVGEPLGDFPTGDDAAIYAWNWTREQRQAHHREAATRQAERGSR